MANAPVNGALSNCIALATIFNRSPHVTAKQRHFALIRDKAIQAVLSPAQKQIRSTDSSAAQQPAAPKDHDIFDTGALHPTGDRVKTPKIQKQHLG